MLATLKDAEANLTTFGYDGFDRWLKTRYPVPAKGGNASSTTDYEQALAYDSNSSVTSFRNRAAQTIGFGYDNLNRVKSKDLPGTEPDVAYAYDNLDRLTAASQSGNALAFGYDALSRKTSESGPLGTTTFGYDLAGRRTSIVYPGTTALTIAYAYLVTGELLQVKQSSTVLADYAYDNLGNRLSVSFGNGASQSFGWDAVSRLASLTNSLTDANDLSVTFGYNPASQIASNVRTGDMYAWTGHGSGSTAYTQNGLNQQVTVGGAAASWDSKGNLTSEPQSGKTYGYSSENLLISSSGGTAASLSYDPALRLYQVAGSATTRFLYDGTDAIAEYNGSSALQRRFVFDPTTGQPVLWYEGSGTASTDRRYLSEDERGSVISVSGSSGASLGIDTYDEYGKPGAANMGRYQYTGQKWVADAGVYDYHYRDYVPQLGVFAQTDPLRYGGDGPNLYAYVLDDPVNYVDPLGLSTPQPPAPCSFLDCSPIYATLRLGGLFPFELISINGLSYAPLERVGGAAGDQLETKIPCSPTTNQKSESGIVHYKFGEFSSAPKGIKGATGYARGSFVTEGGYSGHFETTFFGVSVGTQGPSVSLGVGGSRNLGTFTAANWNIMGTLVFGSISDSFAPWSVTHVGQTDSVSTPGLSIGGSVSYTKITDVQCPVR